jgi:hypothetical protein
MENLIGKRFYKPQELTGSGVLKEHIIYDFEIIEYKLIVYTINSKSFLFEDLEISPYQLIDELLESPDYKSYINSRFNQKTNSDKMLVFLEEKNNKKTKKNKSFKIFGWTITLSKSK